MITPFLALVVIGFSAFMLVLGTAWARAYFGDLREARRRRDAADTRQPTAEAAPGTDRIAA